MQYLHGTYSNLTASVTQETVVAGTIPAYIGMAPINLVRGYADKDLVNNPIEVDNLLDGYAKIGYADDWDTFNLSEVLYAHFGTASTPIGHFWAVNVLDPDIHRGEPVTREIVWEAGRASFAATDIILDTLSIAKEPVEYSQAVSIREAGPNAAGAAGEKKVYDYPAKYAEAGVTLNGNVISYEPTGTIDQGLLHGDHAFVGLVFPKPEGATSVVVDGETVDLTKDSDDVLNGELVQYFAFATSDGDPLPDKVFPVILEWSTGEMTDVEIFRGQSGMQMVEGVEYTLTYDHPSGMVQLSSVDRLNPITGISTVTYETVDPSLVTVDDILGDKTEDGRYTGLHALDLVYVQSGEIIDIICAPGYSHIPEVYNALIAEATKINGHWEAVVYADIPLEDDGVKIDTIPKAIEWKVDHYYNSERSVVCWPMVEDADSHVFHISTLFAVEQLRVDADNNNLPYETASNKQIPVVKQWFGDPDNKGFDQFTANRLNQMGIATACVWAGSFVLYGPHTAAFFWGTNGVVDGPDGSVDPRSYFQPTMRMLFRLANDFQQTWGPEIDRPLDRSLADHIRAVEQEKLDGLVAQGALIGNPRIVFKAEENPRENVLNGDFMWSLQATPVLPLKSATINVAYTDEGLSTYFEEA